MKYISGEKIHEWGWEKEETELLIDMYEGGAELSRICKALNKSAGEVAVMIEDLAYMHKIKPNRKMVLVNE